jgi:hypothetical protein
MVPYKDRSSLMQSHSTLVARGTDTKSVSGEPSNHMHRESTSVTLRISTFSVRCPTRKVHAPFFFTEATVTGDSFLDMLEIWIPIMMITFYNWTELPPIFIQVLLNRVRPQRWIGPAANGDDKLLPWPPHSLDFTPCSFFLLGVR